MWQGASLCESQLTSSSNAAISPIQLHENYSYKKCRREKNVLSVSWSDHILYTRASMQIWLYSDVMNKLWFVMKTSLVYPPATQKKFRLERHCSFLPSLLECLSVSWQENQMEPGVRKLRNKPGWFSPWSLFVILVRTYKFYEHLRMPCMHLDHTFVGMPHTRRSLIFTSIPP